MIMGSHQTFSRQIKHISGQIKFGQTNLLYIINENFVEFVKENECLDNFQPIINTAYILARQCTVWHLLYICEVAY